MIYKNNERSKKEMATKKFDVVVIGGGRVGLPLAATLAKGHNVTVCDTNPLVLKSIEEASPLFFEPGLSATLASEEIKTCDLSNIPQADYYVITIGTPIALHEEFDIRPLYSVLDAIGPEKLKNSDIVLRSTVVPGTCSVIQNYLEGKYNFDNLVISAPERLAEGKAIEELWELPQVIGIPSRAMNQHVYNDLDDLFFYAPETFYLTREEAELSKIFSNIWRYGKFAIVNLFSMIANDYGANFNEVYRAMTSGYERNDDLPKPGFTAGPCLRKDWAMVPKEMTFGLFDAFHNVNEGYADYVANLVIENAFDTSTSIMIYGISMKPGSDDYRDSLTFRLMRKLLLHGYTNLHFADGAFPKGTLIDGIVIEDLESAVSSAKIVVIATPAEWMKATNVFDGKIVIDPWLMGV